MKHLLLTLPFVSLTAAAQNTSPKYELKLYNLTTFHHTTSFRLQSGNVRYYTGYHHNQYLHPAAAFAWHNPKGHAHEIELSDLAVAKTGTSLQFLDSAGVFTGAPLITLEGREAIRTSVALRYEHIIPLWRKKPWRLRPSLGLAVQPFYDRYRTDPTLSSSFPVTQTFLGLRTFVVPRVQYALSGRIFLDVNVPLCVAEGARQPTGIRPLPAGNSGPQKVGSTCSPAFNLSASVPGSASDPRAAKGRPFFIFSANTTFMARYKEELNGISFDIQVNTDSGHIRIQANGIRGTAVYNKLAGTIGKIEAGFDTVERMDTGAPLLAELFRREAAKYFG